MSKPRDKGGIITMTVAAAPIRTAANVSIVWLQGVRAKAQP